MKRLLTFSLAYGAYVAFLHAVSGPWRTWKEGREGKVLDPWTLQHVLWGAIAQRWGLSQNELLALGVVNELGEYVTRSLRPDLLWGTPETGANVAADLASAALGHALAEQLP